MPDKTPRLPKALRRLLWLSLFLLTLAALFSGLRLWLDARGRAVLAAHVARHPAPLKPAMPPAAPARQGGVPADKVALFAQLYSGDQAQREAFFDFLHGLNLTVQASGMENETRINFLDALRRLNLPVPEGMTQAEAAAALLRHLEKLGPFLTRLREACAGENWDFTSPASQEKLRGIPVSRLCANVVLRGAALLAVQTQARWVCGDAAGARSEWQNLIAVTRHSQQSWSDPPGLFGSFSQSATATAKAGLALGGWRDEDLPPVIRDLDTADALDWHRNALEQTRRKAAKAMEAYVADREVMMKEFQRPSPWSGESPTPWKDAAENLALSLTSDTQLAANAALIDMTYQDELDRFNYRDRVYLPPAQPTAVADAQGDMPDPVRDAYFQPADRMALATARRDFAGRAIADQSAQDQTRLALALEAHRRSTGTYPDSLDAVAPFFPEGPPRDVATGQPYFYEKKPDGAFRLWGAGLDQKNDGGAEGKDEPWFPNRTR